MNTLTIIVVSLVIGLAGGVVLTRLYYNKAITLANALVADVRQQVTAAENYIMHLPSHLADWIKSKL